jgi:flagellar motor switch protein FliN
VTTQEALLKIGGSTADAVAGVLQTLIGGLPVEKGAVTVVPAGAEPLENVDAPAVAAKVSYVDGVSGGNVLVLSRRGVRRLAAAMMGQENPEGEEDGELSELELSAVGEALNQMMASAAVATSGVLGEEVEISPPEVWQVATPDGVRDLDRTPYATHVSFNALGESCRLVQLVPNAFVVRMTSALEQLEATLVNDLKAERGSLAGESIRDISVRVWAELGRTRMPIARAVGLPGGAVVKLDRGADEPVDLYVNGRRFAAGVLVVEDGEWAVRVEEILAEALTSTSEGGDS